MNNLKCHHCQKPLVKEESAFLGTHYAHVSCHLQDEKRRDKIDDVRQEVAEYNCDKGGD